jgi:uncharacterized protein YndB with AHSA1/START domain
MQKEEFTAHSNVDVQANAEEVWEALTNPAIIRQYMMGTDVESSWKSGSKIAWKGEFKGKKFEDHGEVLDALPGKFLKYTHITGKDIERDPIDEHIVTVELSEENDRTHLHLSQANNKDEQSKLESEKNWQTMLEGLKKYVEEHHGS